MKVYIEATGCDRRRLETERINGYLNAFLSTQIIVGFPGETEEDYQQSLDLMVRLKLDECVIFGYDDRQRTAASQMDQHISPKLIRHRQRGGIGYLQRHGIPAFSCCRN